jgi:hypothetical protein
MRLIMTEAGKRLYSLNKTELLVMTTAVAEVGKRQLGDMQLENFRLVLTGLLRGSLITDRILRNFLVNYEALLGHPLTMPSYGRRAFGPFSAILDRATADGRDWYPPEADALVKKHPEDKFKIRARACGYWVQQRLDELEEDMTETQRRRYSQNAMVRKELEQLEQIPLLMRKIADLERENATIRGDVISLNALRKAG